MTPDTKPRILPVFIPQWGCPHRCVFCDQFTITASPFSPPCLESIECQLKSVLSTSCADQRTQIAFFGGNFLGLSHEWIHSLLQLASGWIEAGKAHGIRFSTRPDTVNLETVALLEPYPVSTIEIGAQSMDDNVLKKSGRGHTASDTIASVLLLKETGYEVGVQMMIGLPGENDDSCITSARMAAAISPDFVRLYPTLVLSGSPLETLYCKGMYRPLALDRAVSLAASMYGVFSERHIAVIRIGLQPSAELNQPGRVVAGPYHPCFGHLVHSALVYERIASFLDRNIHACGSVVIRVSPSRLSRVEGHERQNLKKIRNRYGTHFLKLIQDPEISPDEIIVNGCALPIP
jgi:histone acetyltransferase (RNA polymerase elongator complex component)